MKESGGKSEELSGRGRPSHPREEVPPTHWNDWRWQLAHRWNTVDERAQIFRLPPTEVAGLTAVGRFRVEITPYFASLMDRDDLNCPIGQQVIPTSHKLVPWEAEMAHALAGYDAAETVQAIEEALMAGDHPVIPLEADRYRLRVHGFQSSGPCPVPRQGSLQAHLAYCWASYSSPPGLPARG